MVIPSWTGKTSKVSFQQRQDTPWMSVQKVSVLVITKHVGMKILTAFVMRPFIVPERAAAIPNLPLFRIFIDTLKPPPISETRQEKECLNISQQDFSTSTSKKVIDNLDDMTRPEHSPPRTFSTGTLTLSK